MKLVFNNMSAPHRIHLPVILLLSLLASAVSVFSAPLSDTLYIEGYYTQQGKQIKRNQLENFLLEQNPSALLADRAKGLRLSAWAVGAPLWCVNTGYSIYQITKFLDAIEKQEMINPAFNNLTVPLVIGTDITLFVQNILLSRSDYAIHKAVVAYNNKLAEKRGPDSLMNHRIKKINSDWYRQDRVLMPNSVLYPLLKDNSASRSLAYWSTATEMIGSQTISIGVMFLALAAMNYFEAQSTGATTNLQERQVQIGVGIGLTSFGIINSIIAGTTKKNAIQKYNESLK